MLFKEILNKLNIEYLLYSDKSRNNIANIQLSSFKIEKNSIFVAIKGFKTDGHKYINDAYKKGCRDFVVENSEFINNLIKNNSTIILVNDCRLAISKISRFLYDSPSEKLNMIGVTGTKGKTTVTTLIYNLLKLKYKISMFTTIKNIINDKVYEAERTTMESNELNSLLNKSVECGDLYSAVEVSSHAVTLKRIYGLEFNTGVFTSFSRDHLDLHNTMEEYFEAKLDFFRMINNSIKRNKKVFINMNDPKGSEVVNILSESVKIIKVGSNNKNDYVIKSYGNNKDGLEIIISKSERDYKLYTKMRGKFNVTNIALAFAVAIEEGIKFDVIKNFFLNYIGVDGRFEIILNEPFKIIIDYAHSPDSLQKILEEAKMLSDKKIICVFGCTGDRDVDKRSIMGEIAAELAGYSIITNDDTYTEDPEKIAFEVEKGFKKLNKKEIKDYDIILDRKEAIKKAIDIAEDNDVIVIAGMGHEKVQILNNGPAKYNDKETVLRILNVGNL